MTAVRRPRTGVRAAHPPWPRCRRCYGLALDLGSDRTRAWIAGHRTILDVPTVTFPGAGAVHPFQRGAVIDVTATARMLDRLLGHRLPPLARPLVVVTTPVLDGPTHRDRARTALRVLRPRAVLTVPTARAVALATGADLTRPLLVVDLGARLTEVVLLVDGVVLDARRTALGTTDLSCPGASADIGEAVTAMITSMIRQDRTSHTADALAAGPLLAGGGALRPDLVRLLTDGLHTPVRTVPAPHTAALRGAATVLRSAHTHPSTRGIRPPRPDR